MQMTDALRLLRRVRDLKLCHKLHGPEEEQEGPMEPFSYTNQHGRTYYLHGIPTKSGKVRYVMRTCPEGAMEQLPKHLEIRENVHGQVSVRRKRKRQITVLEEQLVQVALGQFRPFAYVVDVEGKAATVYASADDRKCFMESLDAEFAHGFAEAMARTLSARYSPELVAMFRERRKEKDAQRPRFYPLLRFVLADKRDRRFAVERVCFTGESTWIRLEVLPLGAAVAKYIPHLGRQSFFDLI